MDSSQPDILAQMLDVASRAWQSTEPSEAQPCGHCLGCRARKFSEEMLRMYEVMDGHWRIGGVTSLKIGDGRGIFFVVLVNDAKQPAEIVTQMMIE